MCVPCCALLIELAYDVLERGPFGRDAVPAHVDDVHEPVADEIGRRNRGPHVLICSNIQEGVCSHHYQENAERWERTLTYHGMSDGIVIHKRPR